MTVKLGAGGQGQRVQQVRHDPRSSPTSPATTFRPAARPSLLDVARPPRSPTRLMFQEGFVSEWRARLSTTRNSTMRRSTFVVPRRLHAGNERSSARSPGTPPPLRAAWPGGRTTRSVSRAGSVHSYGHDDRTRPALWRVRRRKPWCSLPRSPWRATPDDPLLPGDRYTFGICSAAGPPPTDTCAQAAARIDSMVITYE